MSRAEQVRRAVVRVVGSARHLATLACIVLLWQIASTNGWLNRLLLPPPSRIARAWWESLQQGQLIDDVTASLYRVGIGFLIASVVGIALGVVMSTVPLLRRQLGWIVGVLRPIPPIAWIPLAILWFGIGDHPAFFIVFVAAFFPIFTGTYLSIGEVRAIQVNTARSLGASRPLVILDVLFPAALPTILVGLRTGLGVAWMSVIAAELVGARSGLGYRVQLDQVLLRTDSLIAGMLSIGVVGLGMHAALGLLERLLVPWRRRVSSASVRTQRA